MPLLSPNQSDTQAALRSFLLTVLPLGTSVIEGQDNFVAEPSGPNFVVMTTIRRARLETNIDTYLDASFTGYISGNNLTVTEVDYGEIVLGAPVYGGGVVLGTTITAFQSGVGGVGVYTVQPSQQTAGIGSFVIGASPIGTFAPISMAAGTIAMTQPTEVVVQLDVHASTIGAASDMAEAITTAFRDDYAVSFFATINPNISPLHAEEARQVPFVNAEDVYESRYVIEAHLQVNQTLAGFPQQFSDALTVDLISVDATYAP